jgi:hypothetical protein
MLADFAGMWGFKDEQDPPSSCVKSRTGFIIVIQSCPVFCMSKLQTDVATSSTTIESKYNAFSMSIMLLGEVLPLVQNLTKTIVKALG